MDGTSALMCRSNARKTSALETLPEGIWQFADMVYSSNPLLEATRRALTGVKLIVLVSMLSG